MELICEAMVSVQAKLNELGGESVRILEAGSAVKLTAEPYDEAKEKKSAAKSRSTAQNRLIYKAYQRIGKTLYGGDESHSRNECKLRIGCRILYRDSEGFAQVFDNVIRPLSHENKLAAMLLISVSSIMTIPQATEYIKTIFTEYGQRGVYFLDLYGADEYINYPEAQNAT
jgi:hypothetical protein